jgi:uncharacterized protein (DUF2141 family)
MRRVLVLALGAALAAAVPADAGELRITLDGLRTERGTILIGVYDSKATFDRAIELSDRDGFLNDPQRVAGVALRGSNALKGGVGLPNLEPGRYAVIVLHDQDGNGRLDKNFWGVPTEAYGFSNDAQGFLGPPSFKDAAIVFDGGDKTLAIGLVHHSQGVASLVSPYGEDESAASPKLSPRPAAAP